MVLRLSLSVISLFIWKAIVAQDMVRVKVETPVCFKIAYLGSIVYPGLRLGAEYPLLKKINYKHNDTVNAIIKNQFITASFMGYHHKKFHTNSLLTVGFLWRRTNRHKWFADVEPQVGISRTFIHGTVYSVDGTNNVKIKKLAGDWFAVSQLSFSIGKSLGSNNKWQMPIALYGRATLLALFPYNNFVYVRPAVELGVIAPLFKNLTTTALEVQKQRN